MLNTANGLGRGLLGTGDIVFMVMAAAAPMATVVALMPMAFAFGNGPGVPGTYLGAIAAMLLFAIGYVRIVPFVKNAGAFYAYIAASLGRVCGLAAAYVAALSYFALACSTVGALAFFCEQFFRTVLGVHIHWAIWAFGSIAVVSALSYHSIMLAAKVLAVALLAEVLLILILDVGIIRGAGLGAFDLHNFAPSVVLTPGLGIATIYAFNSMIGVEGTAIYQEEARSPSVTVPRATYISVLLVGLFYVFTAWCLTSSAGVQIVKLAHADPGNFIIGRARIFLGQWGSNAIALLVLTSALAAVLGLFNNATRYLYALARDGVLPGALAKTHERYHSPHVAAITLTVLLALVFLGAVIAGLDPLTNVATALVGLGSVGLMALMGITALAIPVYFARQGIFGVGTTLAPAIGGTFIVISTCLAFGNYSLITGVDSALINHLPYVLLVSAAVGVLQAYWLARHYPAVYTRIGQSRVEA